MPSPYRIRTIVFGNGERLPALLDDATGLPLFDPMAYILTEVRARSRAANTIQAQLVGIEALLLHLWANGIDLSERIASGMLLDIHEIDGLVAALHQRVPELVARLDTVTAAPPSVRRVALTSIEAVRQRLPKAAGRNVDRHTAANRLRVVHAYLAWLINQRLGRLPAESGNFGVLNAKRTIMLGAIKARIPNGKASSVQREGLEPEERARLLRLIDPSNPDNPWTDPRVRQRNQLIVQFLYYFGIRGGELLALKLQDLDLRANTLSVVRRPDDPTDPRRNQPTVKTLGRVLPMNQGLTNLTFAYLGERRKIEGAARHPFLFIETDRGRAMSAAALAKIFRELRAVDERLPRALSPHVLRHDWNDRFSESMDRRQTAEPIEEKQRSYLMGWREGSGTAALYTRRHTRRRATKASLDMQAEAIAGVADENHRTG